MNAVSQTRPGWIRIGIPLLVLGLLWSGATAVDWAMRLRWFQWHRSFLAGTAKPRYMGDSAPLTPRVFAPEHGGDLSRMLGIEDLSRRYGLPREDRGEMEIDEFGLPNTPPTTNRAYDVVLVGDSFMLQGRSTSNLLASRLERLIGTPVYTIAHAGRGAAFAMSGFLDHPNFRERPPKVLVWGICERDASGYFFDSMVFHVMKHATGAPGDVDPGRPSILWRNLLPVVLRKSLPDTSLAAQLARQAWSRARYAGFGIANPDVVFSTTPVHGHPMLFYRVSIDSLAWPPEVRDIPKARRAAFYANRDYFRARGIRWIVLLIPEKEQVYRGFVPGEDRLQPESFGEMERELRAAGVEVVNLLPPFRERAKDELLYWPDDTHWNSRGMAVAAETLAPAIRSALHSPDIE